MPTLCRPCAVVVINEADKLSKSAQHALRRIMEKYTASCRYFLCCNNSSKVIGAIRSRCLGIRVSAPTHEEIVKVLTHVAKKENVRLPEELAANIAQKSSRNLRRAILMLEACTAPLSHHEPTVMPKAVAYHEPTVIPKAVAYHEPTVM